MTAIGLYMLLSTVSGDHTAVTMPNMDITNEVAISVETRKEQTEKEKNVDVEAYVREYFKDIPILTKVAGCESGYRQFKNGKVLRGIVNPADVGVMQINEKYHLVASKKLGMDIYTIDGNLAYGRYLYEHRDLGTRPWLASAPCWTKDASAKVAMKQNTLQSI